MSHEENAVRQLRRPDPQYSCEHVQYLQTLVKKEEDLMPAPTFMGTIQGGSGAFMTPGLRMQYCDWLYEETEKLGLDCETAAIALN